MRIIGTIEHPLLKITVFKMEGRTSVKFENPGYEQTYKFGEDERLSTLEGVRRVVDAPFLECVLLEFQQMHRTRLEALARAYPAGSDQPAFEEII